MGGSTSWTSDGASTSAPVALAPVKPRGPSIGDPLREAQGSSPGGASERCRAAAPSIAERFEELIVAQSSAADPPPPGIRGVDATLQVDDGLLADLERARARVVSALAAATTDPALRCGPHVLLECVWRDGAGQMHRAFDRDAQRFVAVRTVEGVDPVPPDGHRALDQARSLRHPNLVALLGHGHEPDGRLWLAYELTRGRTLEPRPAGSCRRTPVDAARLVRDAARGLAFANGLGLGHGGLTPASLLVDRGHRARVLDLGLATLEAASASGAARLLSRLERAGCRAPELAPGATADARGDVFALGAILHRLLTGQPPSDGASEPSAAAALDAVCARCLHDDPSRRYAHAGDLAADLDRWLRGEPPLALVSVGALRRAIDAVAGLFSGP